MDIYAEFEIQERQPIEAVLEINALSQSTEWGYITGDINNQTDLQYVLALKQDLLVSGENIKTINHESILGPGNMDIDTASAQWGNITGSLEDQEDLQKALDGKYDVSNPAGYQTEDEVASSIQTHNTSNQAHSDIRQEVAAKQPLIDDLTTIRANAQAGKQAKDIVDTYGDIPTHNVSEFATAEQGEKADTAIQPNQLGNATITIKQGSQTKGSFTTNQFQNAEISLDGEPETLTVIELTGDDGTLTSEQIALVIDDTKNVVLNNDGQLFRLVNNESDLSYRTYINIDSAVGLTLQAKAIYVQLSSSAGNYGRWSKEDVEIGISGINWGSITGTLSNQADLKNVLDSKMPITVIDIGSYQTTVEATVLPQITVGDAKVAHNALKDGKAVILKWTLYGTYNYLNVISADYNLSEYSIDVAVHNKYHIAYSWLVDTPDTNLATLDANYTKLYSDKGNNTDGAMTQASMTTYINSLQEQITNLLGRGKFLSIWNCTTGLAMTLPPVDPYTYETGSFFIVGVVGTTNYKPSGTTYSSNVPSTVVETNSVKVNDTYYYDGTTWQLLDTPATPVGFSSIVGSPYDNDGLASALNAKYDTSNPSGYQNSTQVNSAISTHNTNSSAHSTLFSQKQDTISDLTTIRSNASAGKTASDTIATYGNIVTHNTSEFATSAQGAKADTAVQPATLSGYVPTSRKINGQALTQDLTIESGLVDDVKVNGTSVVTNKVANVTVPAKTSDLTNDSGYITGITGTDVTTALGYTPYNSTNPSDYQNSTQVNSAISTHNSSASAHSDIRTELASKVPNTRKVNGQELSQDITIDTLPSQSGQSGKYLTTNGTTASWATVSAGANVDLSNLSATGQGKFDAKVDKSSLSEVYPVIATYVSGASGYRIWSDGYCEQWGLLPNNIETSGEIDVTINLLKTFKDSNYNVVNAGHRFNTGGAHVCNYVKTKNTSSIVFHFLNCYTISEQPNWKASGYLAEGQYTPITIKGVQQ